MIKILVSENYNNDKLNNILLLNDTKINEMILDYGVNLYESQKNILEDEILNNQIKIKNDEIYNLKNKEKEYEIEINKLKNDKLIELTSLIEKGKDLAQQDFKLSMKNILNEKKKLEDTINILLKDNKELNDKLINFNKKNENNNYDIINNNIVNLNDKFSNYFEKIFNKNTDKGKFGESFVEDYLIEKFPDCKLIDTHTESKKGDFYFIYNKLKLLVECKNVVNLKNSEIEKFYRDIEYRTVENNEINCALLISLNDTKLLAFKKYFHFEIKYNIPIILISDVFNNSDYIRFAILIFISLIDNGIGNIESDNFKIKKLIHSLNVVFNKFNNQLNFIQNDKKMLNNIQLSYKRREEELFSIDILLKEIIALYPEFILKNNCEEKNNNKKFISIDLNDNKDTSIESNDNTDISSENNDEIEYMYETKYSTIKNNETNNIICEKNDEIEYMYEKKLNKKDIYINKIKIKKLEDPNFSITMKNLEKINIPKIFIQKIGGIKKLNDII